MCLLQEKSCRPQIASSAELLPRNSLRLVSGNDLWPPSSVGGGYRRLSMNEPTGVPGDIPTSNHGRSIRRTSRQWRRLQVLEDSPNLTSSGASEHLMDVSGADQLGQPRLQSRARRNSVRYLDQALLEWLAHQEWFLDQLILMRRAQRVMSNLFTVHLSSLINSAGRPLGRPHQEIDNGDGFSINDRALDNLGQDSDGHPRMITRSGIRRRQNEGAAERSGVSDEEVVCLRLVKILKISKVVNLFMVICHALLLSKAIGVENLMKYSLKARALTLQNVQAMFLPEDELYFCNENNYLDSKLDTTSYYLLATTIMDFVNNLFWYHSRDTIVPIRVGARYTFRERKMTVLSTTINVLLSPRHLFHAAYVGLFIIVGPFGGNMGILVGLLNCSNQILRHGYNFYRVTRYLDVVEKDSLARDNEGSLDLSQWRTMDGCRGHTGTRIGGWSDWPVHLWPCVCEFRDSLRYRFERLQMMSQIFAIKVTIFTLLLNIEALKLAGSLESAVLFVCLAESFLAMYSYYDKYYSRYLESSHLLKGTETMVDR